MQHDDDDDDNVDSDADVLFIAHVRPGATIQPEQETQTERKQAGENKPHSEQRHL